MSQMVPIMVNSNLRADKPDIKTIESSEMDGTIRFGNIRTISNSVHTNTVVNTVVPVNYRERVNGDKSCLYRVQEGEDCPHEAFRSAVLFRQDDADQPFYKIEVSDTTLTLRNRRKVGKNAYKNEVYEGDVRMAFAVEKYASSAMNEAFPQMNGRVDDDIFCIYLPDPTCNENARNAKDDEMWSSEVI